MFHSRSKPGIRIRGIRAPGAPRQTAILEAGLGSSGTDADTRTPPQLLTDTNPPDVICSAPRRRDVNPVYARQISIWKIRETYKCSCQSQPAPLTPLSIQHPGAAGGEGGGGKQGTEMATSLPIAPEFCRLCLLAHTRIHKEG